MICIFIGRCYDGKTLTASGAELTEGQFAEALYCMWLFALSENVFGVFYFWKI